MKRSTILVLLAVTALVVTASPAGAGGWAVTTLDPLPTIEPGQPAAIGFTIRQHGVTPVDLDDVAIVVRPDDGPAQRFAARPNGPTGHYVADVTAPAGSHRWQVEQGWFAPQDLGTLVVGPAAEKTGSDDAWPAPVRWGLLGTTVLAAAVFVWSLTAGRRRGASERRPTDVAAA